MTEKGLKNKRVVLVHWKQQNEVEVFSNLRNFCLSYPQFNYNTINNYLSKKKAAYENETVRVERKVIITNPGSVNATARSIVPVVRRVPMKAANDEVRDWEYWLSQPVLKRAEAVTFLISQRLKSGQQMDKTIVKKLKRDHDVG